MSPTLERPARRRPAVLTGAALLALCLSGCTGSGPDPAASATAPSSSAPEPVGAVGLEQAYRRVIDDVLPSVVEIRTQTGLGSGVAYDDAGHVVTNAHVVGDATTFQVLSSASATPVPARLVGTYPEDDLAVIELQGGPPLEPARFGDSSAVQVGDVVLAMGNPLGLSATVTDGIISARGRTVSEPETAESPGATLPEVLQTSAAINPGNSGGALVALDGQVVGIPTLAALSPEGGGAAPGIGFAIPSDIVRSIADQLIRDGRVTHSGRAALDVRIITVTDPSGQPQGAGVVAADPAGAAAAAGLREGDLITSVDGRPTPTAEALSTVLAGLEPGATTPVVVQRDGGSVTLQVTLGELGAP